MKCQAALSVLLSLSIFGGVGAIDADGASAPTTLKVPTIFADHMVLQRGKTVPIWGWAAPGAKVTVHFAGQSRSATAGKNGRWLVKLSAMQANSEGRTLTIAAGDETLDLKDVLVGEVWVCSGQSNMAYNMARAGEKGMPPGFDASKYPKIRQFLASKVKRLRLVDPVKVGQWSVCSPKTVSQFTAVGFFFARALSRELKVPVGLLNCSKGSTRVEAWTARGLLYRCKVKPLLPVAIRGAIWYQGEQNAGGPDGYAEKLEGLIAGWRKEFDQGDFPFYIVQLPNFCQPNPDPAGGDGWARIREEQTRAAHETANAGQAVIIDTGQVDTAHPDDKVDVGERLALWALAKDYGKKDLVYRGPVFKKMTIAGDKAVLSFEADSVGTGLMVGKKDGMQPTREAKGAALGGFAVAGPDRHWHWADAKIDGAKVVVTCKDVPKPVAVRYGFSSNPVRCNLYNREGLPACPFRTDHWAIPKQTVQTLLGWTPHHKRAKTRPGKK